MHINVSREMPCEKILKLTLASCCLVSFIPINPKFRVAIPHDSGHLTSG